MTARTVVGRVLLPDGNVPTAPSVSIQLIASTATADAIGWVPTEDHGIAASAYPQCDSTGQWSVQLQPNALITPAGTVYRVTYTSGRWQTTFSIAVPDAVGPHRVEDILVDAPATLPSPALSAHIAGSSSVHGILDTAQLVAHTAAVAAGARNLLGGGTANSLGSGSPDACMVLGGGTTSDPNRLTGADSSLCTILGGYDNNIAGVLANSVIAGQHSDIAAGATHGCVVGGSTLTIGADVDYGVAAGGLSNAVNADYGAAVGGASNTVSGRYAAALGGSQNTVSALRGLALGGTGNTASGDYSIVSGVNSTAAGSSAVVLGLNGNAYGGGAAIVGGDGNTVGASGSASFGDYSATIGGLSNDIGNSASARFAAIIGGRDVTVNGEYAAAVAGQNNAVSANHAATVGGTSSTASAARAVVLGGTGGTASGVSSVVLGGTGGTASGVSSVVLGGTGGTASGVSSVVLGGATNSASGAQSIAGGTSSTATTADAIALGNTNGAHGLSAAAVGGALVVVGSASVANRGDYAAAVGGLSVTIGASASARYSGTVGGRTVAVDAEYCGVLGGQDITLTTRPYQSAVGYRATSALYGAHTHAAGYFAAAGDAQYQRVVMRIATTNATPTALCLDGSSLRLLIPNDRTWTVKAMIAARNTDGTEHAGYEATCVVVKGSTAGSTTLKAQTVTAIHEDVAGWDFTFLADTTNGALTLAATGEAGKTIRWVATVDITQVG